MNRTPATARSITKQGQQPRGSTTTREAIAIGSNRPGRPGGRPEPANEWRRPTGRSVRRPPSSWPDSSGRRSTTPHLYRMQASSAISSTLPWPRSIGWTSLKECSKESGNDRKKVIRVSYLGMSGQRRGFKGGREAAAGLRALATPPAGRRFPRCVPVYDVASFQPFVSARRRKGGLSESAHPMHHGADTMHCRHKRLKGCPIPLWQCDLWRRRLVASWCRHRRKSFAHCVDGRRRMTSIDVQLPHRHSQIGDTYHHVQETTTTPEGRVPLATT